MSIAFDTSVDGGLTSSGTSLTWAHTCSGLNRALIVGLFGSNAGDVITGVTYNSIAMTRLGVAQVPGDRYCYLYGLLSPSLGTNNIIVSASTATAIGGQSCSYTGVSAFETAVTNTTASASSITVTATTLVTNCWMVGTFKENAAVAPTAGTATTLRQNNADALGTMDSNASLVKGSNSIQAVVTGGNTPPWAGIAVALEPLAAAQKPSQFFLGSALFPLLPLGWVIGRRNRLAKFQRR